MLQRSTPPAARSHDFGHVEVALGLHHLADKTHVHDVSIRGGLLQLCVDNELVHLHLAFEMWLYDDFEAPSIFPHIARTAPLLGCVTISTRCQMNTRAQNSQSGAAVQKFAITAPSRCYDHFLGFFLAVAFAAAFPSADRLLPPGSAPSPPPVAAGAGVALALAFAFPFATGAFSILAAEGLEPNRQTKTCLARLSNVFARTSNFMAPVMSSRSSCFMES